MKTKRTPQRREPAPSRPPKPGPVTISVYWDAELRERFSAHCNNLKTNASARLRTLALRDLGLEV